MNNKKKKIYYPVILFFSTIVITFSPLSYGESTLDKEVFLQELSTIRSIGEEKSLRYIIELIPFPYIIREMDEKNIDLTYARIILYRHNLKKEIQILPSNNRMNNVTKEDIEHLNPGFFDGLKDHQIEYIVETANYFLVAKSLASQQAMFQPSYHRGSRINEKNYKNYPSIVKSYMIPYYLTYTFTSQKNDVLKKMHEKMLSTEPENRLSIIKRNTNNNDIQIEKRSMSINEIKKNLMHNIPKDSLVEYVSPIFSNSFHFIESIEDKMYLYDKYLPYVIKFHTLESGAVIAENRKSTHFHDQICENMRKYANISVYDLGWHSIQEEVKFEGKKVDYSTLFEGEIVYDNDNMFYKTICNASVNGNAIRDIKYRNSPLALYNNSIERKYNISQEIEKLSQYIK